MVILIMVSLFNLDFFAYKAQLLCSRLIKAIFLKLKINYS